MSTANCQTHATDLELLHDFIGESLRTGGRLKSVFEDPDGLLEVIDGVTRATRIAKFAAGETVPLIVIGRYRRSRGKSLTVGDLL